MSEEVKEPVKQVAKERKDKKGVLRLRSQEVDGVKHGKTEVFDADGKLRSVYEYRNGRKHGESLQYDETGTLRRKAMYCKGILQSYHSFVGEFGTNDYGETIVNRTSKNRYDVKLTSFNNKLIFEYTTYLHQIYKVFDPDVESKCTLNITDDIREIWYNKGNKKHGLCQGWRGDNLVSQVNYVDGLKQGIEFIIHENLRSETHYVNDESLLEELYENNNITFRSELSNGVFCGLQEHFHVNGNIKKRSTMTPDGQEINVQEFDEAGNLIVN